MHSVGESLFPGPESWKTRLRRLEVSAVPDQSNSLRQLGRFSSKQRHSLFVCFLLVASALLVCAASLYYRPGFYDFRLTPVSWFGAARAGNVRVKEDLLAAILRSRELTLEEYNRLASVDDVRELAQASIVSGKHPRLHFVWALLQLCGGFGLLFAVVFRAVGTSRTFQVDDSEVYRRLYHCLESGAVLSLAVGPLVYFLSGVFGHFMALSAQQQRLFWALRLGLAAFTCLAKFFRVDFKQLPQVSDCKNESWRPEALCSALRSGALPAAGVFSLRSAFRASERRDLRSPSNRSYFRWALWANVQFVAAFLGLHGALVLAARAADAQSWVRCGFCGRLGSFAFDFAFGREMLCVGVGALLLYDLCFVLTRLILAQGAPRHLYRGENCGFVLKLLWQMSHSKRRSAGGP